MSAKLVENQEMKDNSLMIQTEFETLIGDTSKTIAGDIAWQEDEDHSPVVEFRVEVQSTAGWPLFIKGSYNALADTLSYSLVHRGSGRIYALDLGKDHHNPTCQNVGEKHKHRWTEAFRDKTAYVPMEITSSVRQPVQVWQQFCAEARINHTGVLNAPPVTQEELL